MLAAACAGDGTAPVAGGGGGAADLAALQAAIWTPKCAMAGCHDAASRQNGLELTSAAKSFEQLVGVASTCAAKVRVVAGDAAASYLMDKLGAGMAPCGDLMPQTQPPLSQAELAQIASWIDGGALPAGAARAADGRAPSVGASSTSTTTSTSSSSTTSYRSY